MEPAKKRRSERVLLTIPIVVTAVDPATGNFSEPTHTVVVNRGGARIALKHRVAAEETLHIINLENLKEAAFRVVGPTGTEENEAAEWGVEYLKEGEDIWGIEFPPQPPVEGAGPCALLECRGCLKRFFWPVTLMEVEVLDSTGVIQNFCDHCGKPTYWAYADISLRPREISPSEAVAPAPQSPKPVERRSEWRVVVKLPILVRNQKGEEEVTRTENISKGNLAVSLALDLPLGDIVTVVCPYEVGRKIAEKKAEVRRRGSSSFFSRRRLYGLYYAR